MSRNYVPDTGHIVWIDVGPQMGREQRGHRPALVLSPAAYNAKTSLILACPITSVAKGYPFEVALRSTPSVKGVVLSDHVKSLDWRARRARYKATVSPETTQQVRALLSLLLGV
ncbi:MAG TPA: endoribonuclease MazF [Candidatus Tyrphobacter sp.]